MRKLEDLTGKVFGSWRVISLYKDNKKTKTRWLCCCMSCNNNYVIYARTLKNGESKSCAKCRVGKTRSNLVNMSYGDLLVLNLANTYSNYKGHKRNIWWCLCKRCNNQVEIKQSCLINGKRTACWKCDPPNGKTTASKDRIINFLIARYKNGAKDRNYLFELTKEEFINLINQNCYYCGIEPETNKISWSRKKILCTIQANGIDRFDNKVGYIYSNCVACCKICNIAKHNLTYEAFILKINKIAKLHPISV